MVPGYSPNCKTSVPVYRVGLEVEGTLTRVPRAPHVCILCTHPVVHECMLICVCHVALDMCTHVGCSTL